MVHPVFHCFEMTVKHGGVRLDADPMSNLHNLAPPFSRDLFGAQLVADALREDFSASARHDLEPAFPKLCQDLFEGEPADPRKIIYFDGGESFDVQEREFLPYGRDHRDVMFKGPIRMEAAN